MHSLMNVKFISLYIFRATMGPSSGEILCFCDTWYLLFCVDDCPVYTVQFHSTLYTRLLTSKTYLSVILLLSAAGN